MISLVVYGRNDSHGYNLHKRVAISINCWAEILDDPDDEILFCDWNTDVGLPTFPEAIADTLTPKARAMLRIFAVPAWVHRERYAKSTHLPTVEPVARNVALARSNPANRWVLATNPDMIFLTENGESLSNIAAGLEDGFYELPRFNLPEAIWEGLPRMDPIKTMETVRQVRDAIDIDEVVCHMPFLRYNAPGDFQLMLREQLIGVGGFNEEMVLGWHIDSNIALRLNAVNNHQTKTLEGRLRGYHCDHVRTMTNLHGRNQVRNSWARFIQQCDSPYVTYPEDKPMGLGDLELREISLDHPDETYLRALRTFASPPPDRPDVTCLEFQFLGWSRASHTLTSILDPLSIETRSTQIAYGGANPELLVPLSKALVTMGFGPLMVWDGIDVSRTDTEQTELASTAQILKGAGFVIVDLALPLATRTDTDSLLFTAWPFEQRQAIGKALSLVDAIGAYDRAHHPGGNARRVAATNVADRVPLDQMITRHVIANSGRPTSRVGIGLVALEQAPIKRKVVKMMNAEFGYEPGLDILYAPSAASKKKASKPKTVRQKARHQAGRVKRALVRSMSSSN